MMEAAMQAAEAAMQEAAARDMHHQQQQQQQQANNNDMSRIAAQQTAEQHMMDLEASSATITMDTDDVEDDDANSTHAEQQLNLLRALQAAEMGEQSGIPPQVLQEMSMLGMDPNDPESIQAILQMMAQQEQENARPEEHYLTIAQNGTSRVDCSLGWRKIFMRKDASVRFFSIVCSCCLCLALECLQV